MGNFPPSGTAAGEERDLAIGGRHSCLTIDPNSGEVCPANSEVMTMTTSQSCSWCHAMNTLAPGRPTFCFRCEHRADVCRMDCDCPRCRRFESPRDVAGVGIAPGDLVEFLEVYQGFTG